MNNAQTILAAYLDRVGLLQAGPLGGAQSAASQVDNEFLESRMRDNARLNNGLLLTAVGMLLLMFLLALLLVLHYRDQPSTIAYICGGSFVSLLLLVRWQRQLWVDKVTTDLFLQAAKLLPAPEVATLAMNYYNLMASGPLVKAANKAQAKGTG